MFRFETRKRHPARRGRMIVNISIYLAALTFLPSFSKPKNQSICSVKQIPFTNSATNRGREKKKTKKTSSIFHFESFAAYACLCVVIYMHTYECMTKSNFPNKLFFFSSSFFFQLLRLFLDLRSRLGTKKKLNLIIRMAPN